eukprot:3164267-Pleurochrysis_carterae.AAC.8
MDGSSFYLVQSLFHAVGMVLGKSKCSHCRIVVSARKVMWLNLVYGELVACGASQMKFKIGNFLAGTGYQHSDTASSLLNHVTYPRLWISTYESRMLREEDAPSA